MSMKPTQPLSEGLAPFSKEAEQAVLGAVLVNSDIFLALASFLTSDDFYFVRHVHIWDALRRINDRNDRIDYVTLIDELRAHNLLDEVGGPGYLLSLANNTPSTYHAESYGRLVERAAVRRRIIAAADEIKSIARDEKLNTEEVQMQALARLDQAATFRSSRMRYMPGAISSQQYDAHIQELIRRRAEGEMLGLTMPDEWVSLRDKVPAIFPGEFVVISGPSGGGKSAFAEAWMEWMAQEGARVHYMHTEMSTEQVLHRRMTRHSGIPYPLLAGGDLREGMYSKMLEADVEIDQWAPRIGYHWMPDPPFLTLTTEMRRAYMAGARVFILDHFQDVQPPTTAARGDNDVRAYERAVTWLAAFAEKRQCYVIVVSQENEQGKTKWTKKLVEKATLWLRMSRKRLSVEYAYVYKGIECHAEPGEDSPLADVFINKARFGKKAKIKMVYHGPSFLWLDTRQVRRPAMMGNKVVNFTEAAAGRAAGEE